MQDYVIVTASDRGYFPMALGLILSIRRVAKPTVPDIVVMDLGLGPTKVETLESLGCRVVDPGWNIASQDAPEWFKAMTARPFLPEHAPGYAKYVWIDSDAWVQNWNHIEVLIDAARDGAIALVEEEFGQPIIYTEFEPGTGRPRKMQINPDLVRKNVTDCYRQCWGDDVAEKYGQMRNINSGVFALEATSDVWAEWRDTLRRGLERGGVHKLAEQQALNIAIRTGRAPAALHSVAFNFLCSHALPEYDPATKRFVVPADGSMIGVLHLADLKMTRSVSIGIKGHPQKVDTSLHYLDLICSSR